MKKHAFLFLLCAIFSTTSYSQQKKEWTFEECVNYALENNIDIRQSQQDVAMADYNRDANIANFAPNLTLSGGYNWNFGLSIDPVTNLPSRIDRQTGNLTLSSSWVLFDGLRNINQYQQGRIDYLASTYQLSAIRNDVTVNVASNYLQIVMNKEVLTVATEQYNNSVRMYEQAQKRREAGVIAEGELLQAESQMASDEQRMVVAENNVILSRLALAQLLQLDDPSSFDVSSPDLDIPEGAILARSPQSIYESAREVQPVIQASELNVQSAELALDQSQGQIWPTISLRAAVSTNYSDQIPTYDGTQTVVSQIGYWDDMGTQVPVFRQVDVPVGGEIKPVGPQLSDNLNQFVGLNLTWPIFSRLQVRNDIRRQEFQVTRAELEQERTENQLQQTIERAHADAKASLKAYNASTKAADAAKTNLDFATIRREEGAISQYEFETARNNYLAAKSQQLQSKYDYIFKIRVLEFYLTNQL
ncbi:MAG: TolC family protein [Flavobacteriia bacterium]|nr:TolC family protein [Flavobacteriia bacterium]